MARQLLNNLNRLSSRRALVAAESFLFVRVCVCVRVCVGNKVFSTGTWVRRPDTPRGGDEDSNKKQQTTNNKQRRVYGSGG